MRQMTSILAASEPASKNTSEYVGLIVNGGKEPKLKNDKNSWMVTYQISAMSAILEARLSENFIGPKNHEQVYLELVFDTDHDAVIIESIWALLRELWIFKYLKLAQKRFGADCAIFSPMTPKRTGQVVARFSSAF